jgi:sec-independent protein translocase protein TatB
LELKAMFDFSWGELMVIGAVALIVIGPKELPTVLRTLGQWMTKIRRMASEFQGQFQEAMREAEMADLKRELDTATRGFGSHFDDPFDETNRPKPDSAKSDSPTPDSSTASTPDWTARATLPAEPAATSEGVPSAGDAAPAAPTAPLATEAPPPAPPGVPTAPTAEPASSAVSTPAATRSAPSAASAATVAVPVAPATPSPASSAPLVTEGSDRA